MTQIVAIACIVMLIAIAAVIIHWMLADATSNAELEQMKDDIVDLKVSASDLRMRASRTRDVWEKKRLVDQATDLDNRAEALTRKIFK